MMKKYLVVALLAVVSTMAFAGEDFESASELRQCAKEMKSLDELDDKLQSTADELSGLDLRATVMNANIEMQKAWVADYNARMRLNADISQYNAFISELGRRFDGHNRNVNKYNDRLVEFKLSCENRRVDNNGDAWKEVCQDSNEYASFCRSFTKEE